MYGCSAPAIGPILFVFGPLFPFVSYGLAKKLPSGQSTLAAGASARRFSPAMEWGKVAAEAHPRIDAYSGKQLLALH
jgi:hypothetical protein